MLELIPPENLLVQLYGKTATELGMRNARREELTVAAMFASLHNDEFGSSYQVPARYLAPTPAEDEDGVDVELADIDGNRLRLQVKGIHIQRAITRKRAGVERTTEAVRGDEAVLRVAQDSEQLAAALEPELTKLIHVDYGDCVLIIHIQGETASQSSLQHGLRALTGLIGQLRAREVWFLESIPTTRPEDAPDRCRVYHLLRARPDPTCYAYHFTK